MRSTDSARCQSPMPVSLVDAAAAVSPPPGGPAGYPSRRIRPMSDDFPLFALSEEHQAIREAVRVLCEAKVAPYAAEVDEEARYPEEAAEALQAADFHAAARARGVRRRRRRRAGHLLVIEEVARAVRRPQPDPRGQQARARCPCSSAGSEELKKKYLGRLAAGEGGFSYCLSEPEAGSDAAAMRTRAVRDGDDWVLNGVKRWITNAGVSRVLHGDGGDRPRDSAAAASRRSSSRSPTRASPSARRRRSSASRAPRPARSTSTTCGSPPTG